MIDFFFFSTKKEKKKKGITQFKFKEKRYSFTFASKKICKRMCIEINSITKATISKLGNIRRLGKTISYIWYIFFLKKKHSLLILLH